MNFLALLGHLRDKCKNRNWDVTISLSLVVLGLTCTLVLTEKVFNIHAAEATKAKFSTESGPSEETRVYFPYHRRLGYELSKLAGEGFLSNPQQDTPYLRIRETYINYDYGYSVVLPKPLVGLRSRPPFPNHGFVINLSEHPQGRLTVDASYNSAEWNSFRDALNEDLDQFRRDSSGEVSIMMQRPAVLGGLKAIHFSLQSAASELNEPIIRDVILAFRKENGGVGIVYEIALTTAAFRYQKDKRSATQLIKSFRLRALNNGRQSSTPRRSSITGTNAGRTGQLTKIHINLNPGKDAGNAYDALAVSLGRPADRQVLWTQDYSYDPLRQP